MIKRRTITLFTLAIVMGIGATILANNWFMSRMKPVAAADTTPVVVAALEIPFGQKIETAHMRTISWPNSNLPSGVYNDLADVEGKIANQTIASGEIILSSRIVEHAQGSTLAAIISPNMRAVTVRVNDVIGVGGFLLPGNRVDVLATRKIDQRRALTKTILEDLKVLAVDQTSTPDKDKPIVVRAVTLEVDPKQAEELVKSTQEGTVQLVLRNPMDESRIVKAEAPKEAPVVKKVAKKVVRRAAASSSVNVTIIRGTHVDVSKVKLYRR